MRTWLVELYSLSGFPSWLLFVLALSLAVRITIVPLSWRAFKRQQVISEHGGIIAQLHDQYTDDPSSYEVAFREFKRQSGVRIDNVVTDYLAILLPLGFLGFLLFRSYPYVASMPEELGLGLTDLVVLGDFDAIWLVLAMSLGLSALLVWSTKSLPESFKKYRKLIIIGPVLLQILIYSTIPLYFNIYIVSSIFFGIIQTQCFRRQWTGRSSIVINMQAIESAVEQNKKR